MCLGYVRDSHGRRQALYMHYLTRFSQQACEADVCFILRSIYEEVEAREVKRLAHTHTVAELGLGPSYL